MQLPVKMAQKIANLQSVNILVILAHKARQNTYLHKLGPISTSIIEMLAASGS